MRKQIDHGRTGRLASEGGAPVRADPIPVAQPMIGQGEQRAVAEVLESGWLTYGARVQRFERELAERSNVDHAVCLSSCTAALELTLQALELGRREEVITTPLTFCSTVAAILNANLTPVLVDVDPSTLAIDPRAVEAAITGRTGALLPVHYAGNPCDMQALGALADSHRLALVADAAHALGANYRGQRIASLGTAACLSFGPTKNITTGEGGAVLTSNAALAAQVRLRAFHGIDTDAYTRRESSDPWAYQAVALGRKHNMTDIEAALGLEQLGRLDAFVERRHELVAFYNAAFEGDSILDRPNWTPDSDPAYHLYPVRLRLERLRVGRSEFARQLRAEGVQTSVHFIPVHYHPYFRKRLGLRPGSFPVAENAYSRILSLPLYPGMSDADATDVVTAVRKVATAVSADREVR